MSSVECLRDFVSERLTAAAEEIFGVFIKTIVEYEDEIDRQRRLLDVVLKPQIKLHRTELPQQHDCMEEEEEEEVLSDQQPCDQERNSSLDQEDSDPPQIKEEQRDLSTSQEGEQLVLKLETDTFVTPTYKESDHSEPESKTDHQLLSENRHVAERQDQKGGMYGDSRPTTNTEPEPKKAHPKSRSQGIDVFRSNLSEIDQNMHTSEKKQYSCEACGKAFKYKSRLRMHMKTHTGEKPYPCNSCEKRFAWTKDLRKHVRIHTDEKPYSCTMCTRVFKRSSNLVEHVRTHTGEKPYICKTCGRAFARSTQVTAHMRRAHTGEKPYLCKICGKRYFERSVLTTHMSVKHKNQHTGEEPSS